LYSWRIELDFGIACHWLIKTDRLPIHQDDINLRMRYAAGFDDVFYGGLFAETALNVSTTSFLSKKKLEIAMEFEPNRKGLHIS
jgi:hypothetical protein